MRAGRPAGARGVGSRTGPPGGPESRERAPFPAPDVCVELTPPPHSPALREGRAQGKGLRSGVGGASLGEEAGCLSSATMKVKVIPVLEDNYMYLVIEEHTREAVAVDVAVPKRVRATCGRRGAPLRVWATGPARGPPDHPDWSRPFPIL